MKSSNFALLGAVIMLHLFFDTASLKAQQQTQQLLGQQQQQQQQMVKRTDQLEFTKIVGIYQERNKTLTNQHIQLAAENVYYERYVFKGLYIDGTEYALLKSKREATLWNYEVVHPQVRSPRSGFIDFKGERGKYYLFKGKIDRRYNIIFEAECIKVLSKEEAEQISP